MIKKIEKMRCLTTIYNKQDAQNYTDMQLFTLIFLVCLYLINTLSSTRWARSDCFGKEK